MGWSRNSEKAGKVTFSFASNLTMRKELPKNQNRIPQFTLGELAEFIHIAEERGFQPTDPTVHTEFFNFRMLHVSRKFTIEEGPLPDPAVDQPESGGEDADSGDSNS